MADFAHWYRSTVLERYQLEHLASEITITEEYEDGRRFYGMGYHVPSDDKSRCAGLHFVRIWLSHAYPAKNYAYVVAVARCEGGNPFENTFEEEIEELRIALNRFREWDYYRDEELRWSFSAPIEWTNKGWVDSYFMADGPSRGRFNSGLYFAEDEGQGIFLVEIHRLSEDRLSEFADEYRANLLSMATEQESLVFEMSSVTTTLYRGRESARYTVREQTAEEFCIEDAEVRHILVEPPGYGEVVITTTGGVCESAPDDVTAARDAMMESLRP